MKIGKYLFFLSDLRPIEFEGFKYVKGTYNLFGLKASLCQLSPLLNLLLNLQLFKV